MLATVKKIQISFMGKLSHAQGGDAELQECCQGGGYKATLVRLIYLQSVSAVCSLCYVLTGLSEDEDEPLGWICNHRDCKRASIYSFIR